MGQYAFLLTGTMMEDISVYYSLTLDELMTDEEQQANNDFLRNEFEEKEYMDTAKVNSLFRTRSALFRNEIKVVAVPLIIESRHEIWVMTKEEFKETIGQISEKLDLN